MPQKPFEYWMLVCTLTVYMVLRSPLGWLSRIANAFIASGLALALSGLAGGAPGRELLAAALIQLLGITFLDTITTIAADRQYWATEGREMVAAWLRLRLGLPPKSRDNADDG